MKSFKLKIDHLQDGMFLGGLNVYQNNRYIYSLTCSTPKDIFIDAMNDSRDLKQAILYINKPWKRRAITTRG